MLGEQVAQFGGERLVRCAALLVGGEQLGQPPPDVQEGPFDAFGVGEVDGGAQGRDGVLVMPVGDQGVLQVGGDGGFPVGIPGGQERLDEGSGGGGVAHGESGSAEHDPFPPGREVVAVVGLAYPVDRCRGLAGQQQGLGAGDVAPPGE